VDVVVIVYAYASYFAVFILLFVAWNLVPIVPRERKTTYFNFVSLENPRKIVARIGER
jgi:hypothetical protein